MEFSPLGCSHPKMVCPEEQEWGESHSMNAGGGGCRDAEKRPYPHSSPFHFSHRGMMTSASEVPQSVSPELRM